MGNVEHFVSMSEVPRSPRPKKSHRLRTSQGAPHEIRYTDAAGNVKIVDGRAFKSQTEPRYVAQTQRLNKRGEVVKCTYILFTSRSDRDAYVKQGDEVPRCRRYAISTREFDEAVNAHGGTYTLKQFKPYGLNCIVSCVKFKN